MRVSVARCGIGVEGDSNSRPREVAEFNLSSHPAKSPTLKGSNRAPAPLDRQRSYRPREVGVLLKKVVIEYWLGKEIANEWRGKYGYAKLCPIVSVFRKLEEP